MDHDDEWMFVNRQLYEVYLSFEYADINIKLDQDSDKRFNAIVHSIFKPGHLAKEIFVEDFTAPKETNFNTLDKSVDPLYLLMKNYPFVKRFNFSASPNEEEEEEEKEEKEEKEEDEEDEEEAKNCDYFSAVLMDCDIWKLECIPSVLSKSDRCLRAYFNCAYSMLNTLTELELTKGMIGKGDYHLLGEFQQLQEIRVGDGILNDLYDCDILVHLPKTLTKISVDSFQMGNNISDTVISDSNNKTININTIFDFSTKLKKLPSTIIFL